MTLRLRLLLIIGLSFTILWSAVSIWMLVDLQHKFRDALDERLAASARMVAGLMTQLPQTIDAPESSTPPQRAVLDILGKDGVACEIRLLRGDVIARTHNSPAKLSLTSSGYSTRTIQNERWRTYTLDQNGLRVTTADRMDRREEMLHDVVVATAVPFLIAMFGSLIMFWFGIRKGLGPLESLRQAIAESKPDSLQPISTARLPAELMPLVRTINHLLDRTHKAIERERHFTGDAAHELRTPLTAIKTHIQVARLANGETTAQALGNAEQAVLRLQSTIEQLLMLARVEGPFYNQENEASQAKEIVDLAMNELPPESKKRIVLRNCADHARLAVPSTLAMTALRNILDNALRYSPSDKPVILNASRDSGYVAFQVLDEGPGMSEKECLNAAHRFWRQGQGKGSGLGLSIVDAIVKRYGGEFKLRSRPEGGLAAAISFPAA